MYSLGTHRVSRELPGDALRDGSDREKFREEFSIVDDLDALSAVSRFSRTHFDHQGHLEASSGHDCDPDREAGNFLRHRCRKAFHTGDDRLQVIRIRDLQNHLRVALAEHVLVDLRSALRDDTESQTELAAF